MSKFPEYVERVLKHEGGYVNDPRDNGGETMYGITVAVARACGYTGRMRDMPRITAMAIYKQMYWTPVRGDDLPPAVAWQVFDAGVNHGVRRAAKWLQQVVHVAQDGQIGPVTLAAVKRMSDARLTLEYNAIRLQFYTDLADWNAFGKGWSRRVATNLKQAAGDL